MTDEKLAEAVEKYDFSTNDAGLPCLPPATTRLGRRLQGALVNNKGAVSAELKPLAQAALLAKRFTLATSTDGRRTGLDPRTPRTGATPERPMTDEELEQAVKDHDFITNDDGLPRLPPATTRLGRRLYYALVNKKGAVSAELGPLAQAALLAKRFTLATSTDGRRTGLHSDTLCASASRAGVTRQRPMTDAELAEAVTNCRFSTNDAGLPCLPPATTRLGRRLYNALVNNKGAVSAELGPEAQAALLAKRFTLATSTHGRRTGLHPDTPRAPRTGETPQRQRAQAGVPVAVAAAAGPMRGGPGPGPALPRTTEPDDGLATLWRAAAAAVPGPGPALPRTTEPDDGLATLWRAAGGGPRSPTPQTPLSLMPAPGSPRASQTGRGR
ncbi:hypothetical protein [Streptomyces globisporus]|uniref:hypothetical protein n=1 Tax=Streptomyces globisporus TaxID=1908 RepID=UPI00386982F4